MPAIRDYSQGYASALTNAQIAPTPAYAENDLLVAAMSCDTAAANQQWIGGENLTYWRQDSAGAFTSYDTAGTDETVGDSHLTRAAPAANDACYFGHASRFNGLTLLVSTAGAGTQTWAWEYWNGAAWTAITVLGTNRISLTATAGPRSLMFNPPTDWATTTVDAVSAYWIRMRISAFTSQTTRPLYTRGWIGTFNLLLSRVSGTTAGTVVMYKVASASETNFGYQFAEDAATLDTRNCAVISVRDIDTAVPFATTTPSDGVYSESNADAYEAIGNGTTLGASQCWSSEAAPSGRLACCKWYLKKNGSPTGNAVAKLYAITGSKATTAKPTGVALAVSDNFDVSTLTTTAQLIKFTFPWYFQYQFTASTAYCITIEYSGGDASNYIQVGYDNSASTHSGNRALLTAGPTWTASGAATPDMCFYVYKYAIATSTQTTMRWNMPTMTSERDNSLVLWHAAQAAVSVPSIIEGPCTMIAAKDGSNHSDCWSWGWQKTAGTTPTVAFSCMGTGAQVIAASVCCVNPPTTGATVIPAYCSADSSLYISPLTGAAFDADSAPAATVTTPFGTTLNGATLANGSATVTLADTGINTYHAMAACTTVAATTTSWYGTRQTIASRNLAAKNLLFHIQPATPIAIQVTDSVALPTACGIAFGLSSTSGTHYKVYHVGGSGYAGAAARWQPIVVNTDYVGAGMIKNTGTLVPSAVTDLGFMVSGKVVAASWLFGSMWRLDTTTVAGGNATEPVDVPGIIRAASDGHERRSIVGQGAGQFLCLQPLQLGDGGTNPIYLSLDGTALEFPTQYNKDTKKVSYLSVDNACGLRYYPGSSDTIIHKNSTISSESRYDWGLHSSASTSATYDLSGLLVIGAGTVSLARAITLSELTINDYSSLDITNLTLNDSTIKNVPASNDSVTSNSTTNLNRCIIDVSTVTSGNRWLSTATPNKFTDCAFTGGGGHALRITAPGTYAMVGNTFANFGADTSNGAAIYNDSGGAVTLNISGGGSVPTYRNGTSATTTINNTVTLTITCKNAAGILIDSGIRIRIEKVSDGTLITEGTTDAFGVFTDTYNYTADLPVNIIARRKGYKFNQASDTILSTGLSIPFTMLRDEAVSLP